ncbi:CDP-glycerol glycerophosphotransferase family protein [Microbacterium sp. No. 7]|uniref:CDP-glycerol glycerophosphotransferase family protein n=1 Tax=Microbacterium sp. No. 7 TaxID=1714373 RepID=UPI0006ED481A|nr:CDP-glycerol glycerophosphotransferase family protein [Microbacterium sp. No. 7]ALJ19043.1 hypothetical protein AOA12_03630 [Microbacterium sp. No. 7]
MNTSLRLRLWRVRLRETLVRLTLRAAFTLIAPTPSIVAHGWRDGEENALQIVRGLLATTRPGVPIVLLCEEPAVSARHLGIAIEGTVSERVSIVRKNSLRGLWLFVRARVAFSTHGMFCNPHAGRRRLHVLLGHGHGPKSASNPLRPFLHGAHLATTNNDVWGMAVIADQGIDVARDAFTTGNPRDDVFTRPVDRSRLAALGIDPAAPLLLWLPTYRVPRNEPKLTGLPEIGESAVLRDRIALLRDHARERGVTVVTKAHQLDDQRNVEGWGFTVVTDHTLLDAGLSFFQLLSLADGLVSDYSSVWVDYLARSRPVGLVFADDVEFARGRGFNSPAISEVAAELCIVSDEEMAVFVDAVVASFATGAVADASSRVAERLALRRGSGATRRVLEVVQTRMAEMGLPPLVDVRRMIGP